MNSEPESPSDSLPQASIHVHGRHLLDNHDRVIHLRGANVSGCSKVQVDRWLRMIGYLLDMGS
jgi:hypothetical protein